MAAKDEKKQVDLGPGAQTADASEPDNGSTTSTQDRPNGDVELAKQNALLQAELEAAKASAEAAAALREEKADERVFKTAKVGKDGKLTVK